MKHGKLQRYEKSVLSFREVISGMGSIKFSQSLFLDSEGCDIVVAGLTIGLDDFKGPFQPQ